MHGQDAPNPPLDSMYSDIEGGLGWWSNTRFATETPKFIMLGLRNDVPRYAIAVNAGGDLRALRTLFEKGVCINPNEFTDTSVTARAFAKSATAAHNAGQPN